MSTITIERPASIVAAPLSSPFEPVSGHDVFPLGEVEAASPVKRNAPTREDGPSSPEVTFGAKQKWHTPQINRWRLMLTFFALFDQGLNDASFGAVLPYVGSYYQLSYTVVSVIFIAPALGYFLAALSNDRIHTVSGQRGVAIIGPLVRISSYIVLTQHPPYPVIIVFLVLSGFGTGLLDSAWNAYVGDFADANQILGIMHGMYGLGATLAPLIATALITQTHAPWWIYYYVPMGLNVFELLFGAWAFWAVTGAAFRRNMAAIQGPEASQSGNMRAALKSKVTWYCAAFLFVYVGLEVSIGGWLVTFMQRVRSVDPFRSGITATGFWAGVTVGRLVLGFVTPLMGERRAISVYLLCAIGLELVFWLVPSAPVSAVAAALIGVAIGPLFPGAIVMATKLLPKHLHVPSVGFAAALGGAGSAVLPFAVGALAQAKGVQALEPVLLVLLVLDLAIWLLLPRIPKHAHGE